MATTPVETYLGGTGSRLARATIIVAGVASLVASLLSLVSIWLQTKNYRKPLLQRYVIRILVMVPIYAVSSWTSIVSLQTSSWIAPIRDIYEAFTIYTFFQLLINVLGGERALIIMTHGRPPVQHAWPLNKCLPKVDISDPYTFLTIKRGILQYAWLKPILALISIVMRATDTYQEGYLGVTSGYLWTGIIYNLSVTISLYSLALFWVCMHEDLKPYRPVPKFLCIKLIIFASYWQGFFLSILQWLGALENGIPGYTPDNLAAAIQDSLICFEMPIFAIAHWHAFSWHDFADPSVSSARMPIIYALRDAFGIRDLIEDSKETFRGEQYQYRFFDSGDNVMAHEESNSRLARVRDGMRYERGGKAKYWIPRPGDGVDSRTPLLGSPSSSSRRGFQGGPRRDSSLDVHQPCGAIDDLRLDDEDEMLFDNARSLDFGDWNYPVIPATEVSRAHRLPSQAGYGQPSPYRDQPTPRPARKGKRRGRCSQSFNEPAAGPSTSASATNASNEQGRADRQQNDADLFFDGTNSVSGERGNDFSHGPRQSQNTQLGIQSTTQTTVGNDRQVNQDNDSKRQSSSPAGNISVADEDNQDGPSSDERLVDDDFGAFDEERDAWSRSGVLR